MDNQNFQPNQNQQQGYTPHPPSPPGYGLSIASLVLGIIALVLNFVLTWLPLILAIIGLILGVVGKKRNSEVGAPSGMATAGIVLCLIVIGLALACLVACASCLSCAALAL